MPAARQRDRGTVGSKSPSRQAEFAALLIEQQLRRWPKRVGPYREDCVFACPLLAKPEDDARKQHGKLKGFVT